MSDCSSLAAAAIMAVVPAHLMRSVAGGYDNESIAVSALCATFYLWARALRSDASWPAALLCGANFDSAVEAGSGQPCACQCLAPCERNAAVATLLLDTMVKS